MDVFDVPPALLLILSFISRVTRSSPMHVRPYSIAENISVGASESSNNVHIPTVDCGDWDIMSQAVGQCQHGILNLAEYGYPWYPHGHHGHSRNNPNVTSSDTSHTILTDALNSLNHVCHIHDRSQTCLKESGISDYCLATTENPYLHIDFHFICHHQRRDESLVHSLQCLYNTRLLATLYI